MELREADHNCRMTVTRTTALAIGLALAALAPAHATEYRIKDDGLFGCKQRVTIDRLEALFQNRDEKASDEFLELARKSGECVDLTANQRVCIDDSYPRAAAVCVAPFGSLAPCLWVFKDFIKVSP